MPATRKAAARAQGVDGKDVVGCNTGLLQDEVVEGRPGARARLAQLVSALPPGHPDNAAQLSEDVLGLLLLDAGDVAGAVRSQPCPNRAPPLPPRTNGHTHFTRTHSPAWKWRDANIWRVKVVCAPGRCARTSVCARTMRSYCVWPRGIGIHAMTCRRCHRWPLSSYPLALLPPLETTVLPCVYARTRVCVTVCVRVRA